MGKKIYDPKAIYLMFKTLEALLLHHIGKDELSNVPKRGVSKVMTNANGPCHLIIESHCPTDCRGNGRNVKDMLHSGTYMVVAWGEEDLRLMLESSEGLTMENPVAIALEAGTDRAGRFGPGAPLGRG